MPALQPDLAPQLVVLGQLERLRVEIDDRALRPAPARGLPPRRADTGSPAPARPPRASDRRGSRTASRRALDRLLDVARDGGVALAARRTRDGRVRDLADQHVLERELHVPGELARSDRAARGRAPRARPAPRRRRRRRRRPRRSPARTSCRSTAAESSVLARLGRHRIDARSDRLAHRHRQLAAVAELGDRSRELLEEERDCRRRPRRGAATSTALSGSGRRAAPRATAASAGCSGSSGIVVWASETATPRRAACRAARAARRRRAGPASRARAARGTRAARSRSLCAQWMSSNTNTVGCARPAHSTKRRAAKKSSRGSGAPSSEREPEQRARDSGACRPPRPAGMSRSTDARASRARRPADPTRGSRSTAWTSRENAW